MRERYSDAELMEQVRDRDDPAAMEALIARWRPGLNRFFGALLGDPAAAEDAAQEVLLRLWLRRAEYQPTGRFSAYVWTLARHHWLNLRRQPRLAEPAPAESAASAPLPEQAVLAAGELARLTAAVADLPIGQRAVIELVAAGCSERDAAATLGLPVGTVKSRLHHARRRLRAALEGD